MKRNKLKVGIAGYGVVGKRRNLFIDQHPAMQTVAVSDVRFKEGGTMIDGARFNYNYELLEKRSLGTPCSGTLEGAVRFYNNYNDLLENHSLDILFVCLPNYLAPGATIAGLENGLHVFCEKPPGRDLDDIKRVIEVEKKKPSLKLKYGFNHRYHGSVMKTKELIDSGQYGEILNFRGIYGKSSIIPFSGGWRCERKYAGGGILLDQGIHMLDMLRFFCGDFGVVKSFVSNDYWHHDVEDNAYAIMRDKLGRIATIHSTATQWQHRFRLEITLQEALIELSGILSGSKSYGEEKLKIVPRKDESFTGSHDETIFSYLEDNSWKEEVNEFADIILKDEPVVNGNSSDALKVMKMVYKIYYADENWRKKYNICNPDK